MTEYRHPVLPHIKFDVEVDSLIIIVDGDVKGQFDLDEVYRLHAVTEHSLTPGTDLRQFFIDVCRITKAQSERVVELFVMCIGDIERKMDS